MFYLILYICVGGAFDLFMSWLITILENQNEEDLTHLRFSNTDKILNLFFWPYHVIVFLIGMFQTDEEE